jgi:hypothetical protein
MASSSSTPKLIIPDEKSPNKTSSTHPPLPSINILPSSDGATKKKLTKILSTQSSFERHHPQHPIGKRFSIDADPSSIILNTPVTDLSNNPSQQPSDVEEISSNLSSMTGLGKESSPARSSSLKKSDSFLEIPYEKAEIVDLIKFADDPNSAAHMTNDGNEVLLEHGAAPQ